MQKALQQKIAIYGKGQTSHSPQNLIRRITVLPGRAAFRDGVNKEILQQPGPHMVKKHGHKRQELKRIL